MARLSRLVEEYGNELETLVASEAVQANSLARRCLELEFALSDLEFDGIPVSPALTDLLGSTIYRGQPLGRRRLVRELLLGLRLRYRGVDHGAGAEGAKAPTSMRDRFVVSLFGSRPYHRDWVPHLVELLPFGRTWVISNDVRLRSIVAPISIVTGWRGLPQSSIRKWHSMYEGCSAMWKRTLSKLPREVGISSRFAARIERELLVASQRIHRYGAFLDRGRPSAILVEHDRDSRSACLVLAARSRGIPTLTMVHGVVNAPFGFTPVLADRVLCWGELQVGQFMRFGVSRDRIQIVGFERLTDGSAGDRKEARVQLGISREEDVALLATNPIEPSQRLRFAEAFCQAVSKVPGFRGVIRIHPSERLNDYDPLRSRYPGVLWTSNTDFSLEDALVLADVVIVHSSGFGNEALAKGRICVVFDVLEYPLGNGKVLIRDGGMPRADSEGSLAEILSRIRRDDSFRRVLKRKGSMFSRRMFAAVGAEAHQNIAGAMCEAASIPQGERRNARPAEDVVK